MKVLINHGSNEALVVVVMVLTGVVVWWCGGVDWCFGVALGT